MTIQAGSVEVEFGANLDPLKQGIQEATEITEEGASQIQNAASGAEGVFSGIGKKARQEFEEFKNAAADALIETIDKSDEVKLSLQGIGNSLKSIGAGVFQSVITTATGSLVKMAKAGISDTQALENVQIQMIGLTDSVEKGNEAMRLAINYYKNNPFNRFEVTDATKSLIQFGAELEEIPGILDKLGKVSLSTGAKIDTLAYYYQRMTSDGKINMIDLQQMQTQGIAIFGALAKQLNTTSAGVRELSSQGKISVEDFKKAFDSLVSDEAMERFEKTLSRQVDRFKGRLSDLRGALAGYVTSQTGDPLQIDENGIYRSYTKLLKKIADTLTSTGNSATNTGKSVVEGFQKLSQSIGKIIDKITVLVEPALNMFGKVLNFIGDNSELILPILGVAIVSLTRLAGLLPGIGPMINSISGRVGDLKNNLLAFIKLKPGLSAVTGILALGFMEAYKNDEEFKNSIKELVGALGELAKSLMEIAKTVLKDLVEGLKTIASSDAVKTVLKVVASALSSIAKAIASIPPDDLAMIISFFVSLKLLKANPILLVASAIVLLISYLKQLADSGKNLPQELLTMGHNMMTGLFNGIQQGAKKVIDYIKQLGQNIISAFKQVLQIHSPSKVFYNAGEMITLGLAEGIEDSSDVVQNAMDNLASDILKASEKVISNKVDFGILDIKQEYQEWKKVSKLFTQGSAQYNSAIEKMEDARKKANLKILDLQKTYNNALDSTIDKIANMYGLFDDVSLGAGKNSNQILKGIDQQLAKMSEWAEAQDIISGLDLDDALKEELQSMGVAQVGELSAITQMTADELATLNDMWLKKQSIAENAGVKQMANYKEDTLKEINELKKGIDGDTIDIQDAGGRLVESFSEGVYGAMPTLESALSQLDDYIEKAKKKLGSGSDTNIGAGDDEDKLPGLDELNKDFLKQISEKAKDMIPKILLAMGGAAIASKVIPKVISKIFGGLSSKLLSGGGIARETSGVMASLIGDGLFNKKNLGKLLDAQAQKFAVGSKKQDLLVTLADKLGFYDDNEDNYFVGKSGSVVKAGRRATSVVKPTQQIASSTTAISNSIQQTGQGFSKVTGVFEVIKKGAQTIIWIAVAIAAVAGALWVTYNALKEVDFQKLGEEIGAMVEVTAIFGILAGVAQKLGLSWKGVLIIAGIAIDVAAIALACRVAYELMKGISWEDFAIVLSQMGAAILEFGVLNGVLGIKPIAIAEGLGLLVSAGIVAEIIAVSEACRHAYDTMKGMEWETFGTMLGQMAAAMGTFGGLNAVLGIPFVAIAEIFGEIVTAGIIGEIKGVSQACREAYDTMLGMSWDSFSEMIKMMSKALGAFGLLNAPLGIMVGLEVLGWVSVLAVCDELKKVSEALVVVNNSIPENFGALESKLQGIKRTLEIINGMDLGTVIGMMVTSWSAEPVERIVKMYANVAEQLNKIGNIELDQNKINESLDYIKTTIEGVKARTDVISGWLEASALDMEASAVENAGRVLKVYGDLVDSINKLATFDVDDTAVNTGITKMAGVVGNMRSGFYGTNGGGIVGLLNGMGTLANDVEKIKSIAENYLQMVPTLNDLGKNENQIKDDIRDKVEKNVRNINSIVLEIGKVDTGGWIDTKANDVDKIKGILNNFIEMVPKMNELKGLDVNADENNGPIKNIKAIRKIVLEIGKVDTGGWIDQKESDVNKIKSILDRFVEVAKTSADFEKYAIPQNATGWIETVRNMVWEIGQINTTDSDKLDTKIGVVDKAKAVAQKLMEFASLFNGFESNDNSGIISTMTSNLNQLVENVKTTLLDKIVDFTGIGEKLGAALELGLNNKAESMKTLADKFQGNFWREIQSKIPDEYNQGKHMGEEFRRGLYEVDFANSGWWAVQGFLTGVNNRAYYSGDGSVYNAGRNVASTFLQGLKDRAKEGSPWATTKESGAWAVEGLLKGIQGSENALVGEAKGLAEQVVDALTLGNVEMAPNLDLDSPYLNLSAPRVDIENGNGYANGRSVIIEQTNNNYTEYDLERINRDLAWNLAKV